MTPSLIQTKHQAPSTAVTQGLTKINARYDPLRESGRASWPPKKSVKIHAFQAISGSFQQ